MNNVNYDLPSDWSDVTLAQYEKWYDVEYDISSKKDELIFVSKVTGIDLPTLLNTPLETYNDIREMISFSLQKPANEFKNGIDINGVKFYLPTERTLIMSEFVDVCEIDKSDGENKLASNLAILCKPLGEEYNVDLLPERIELFKNLTMDKCYPYLLYCYELKKKYSMVIQHSLMVQEIVNQLHQATETSLKNGGGIIKLLNWRMKIYNKWTKFCRWVLSKF